jgi:hypothetical protein
MGRREKDIKLLVEKFIELVESLNPGERLSIKKVSSKGKAEQKKAPKKPEAKKSNTQAKPRR